MEQSENATDASSVDISDLFRKIGQGERDALFDLHDRTGRLLFGLTLKILGNHAAAGEALLDFYVRIWKNPAFCDSDHHPLTWLVMAARAHALARLYESRRVYAPTQTKVATDGCEKNAANMEQKNARIRFESLAPIQRDILDWTFYSGLGAGEIAVRTGTPAGAIRTHVRIGLNRLSQASEFPETAPVPTNYQETPVDESEGAAT
jgi:RNA polymerase sigma-70 factor (ECF subfamily)